jgi:arabinan endo-1,5-alpha-L-arabinosidase
MLISFRNQPMTRRVLTVEGALLSAIIALGCSSESNSTKGENGTGGGGTGGASEATGGRTTAGTTSAVGKGGSGQAGSGSGGLVGNGGANGHGGAIGHGGLMGSGGAVGVGGATGYGGSVGSGGLTGSGGAVGVGGATSTGGVVGMGGVSSDGIGGSSGAGGATTASGGSGTGGATGSGGSSVGGATGSGGGTSDDLCDAGVWDGTSPNVLDTGLGVHDPTMISEDGTFYALWTGDYIPIATSTNLTDWTSAGSVYGGNYPSWSEQWLSGIPGQEFEFPWAPDVVYFGGKYHLYSAFSAVFGDNISCITHLTASTMIGPWTDLGPIICTEGSENYNAIDPDVGLDEAGTPWLAFGSYWNGIMAFELDLDGNRVGTELTRLANNSSIEAPVLFRRCGYYYLFVSWGTCCKGADSTYNVRVGRAENIMGPYYAKDGTAMLDSGGTLMVEGDGVDFAAAGHSEVIVVGDKIYHFYHAYRQGNGASVLRLAEMPFDEDGWPIAAGP